MKHEHEPQPEELTFEVVVAAAKETLLVNGTYPPLLVIKGKPHAIGIDVDFPPHSQRRHEMMYVIGVSTALTGVVDDVSEMFLISEAWMSDVEPGQHWIPKPSQDPKRREVLIISSVRLHDRQQRAVVIEMLRDSAGTLRELRDVSFETDSPLAESPLLNAFVDGYTQGRASLN